MRNVNKSGNKIAGGLKNWLFFLEGLNSLGSTTMDLLAIHSFLNGEILSPTIQRLTCHPNPQISVRVLKREYTCKPSDTSCPGGESCGFKKRQDDEIRHLNERLSTGKHIISSNGTQSPHARSTDRVKSCDPEVK